MFLSDMETKTNTDEYASISNPTPDSIVARDPMVATLYGSNPQNKIPMTHENKILTASIAKIAILLTVILQDKFAHG
jgi:hypothetical protein